MAIAILKFAIPRPSRRDASWISFVFDCDLGHWQQAGDTLDLVGIGKQVGGGPKRGLGAVGVDAPMASLAGLGPRVA